MSVSDSDSEPGSATWFEVPWCGAFARELFHSKKSGIEEESSFRYCERCLRSVRLLLSAPLHFRQWQGTWLDSVLCFLFVIQVCSNSFSTGHLLNQADEVTYSGHK